jgi:predicted nucleotidyltransferase
MTPTKVDTKSLVQRLPAGLLERIVAHLNPQQVIVFGSQATVQTHEDSDWDLIVVVDDDIAAERIGWRGI